MKRFIITVLVAGQYFKEHPRCPSRWKGSGCYDITVDCQKEVTYEVYAPDREAAEALAGDSAWADEKTVDFRITKSALAGIDPEGTETECNVISDSGWQDGAAVFAETRKIPRRKSISEAA